MNILTRPQTSADQESIRHVNRLARQPDAETKFPVGPASAKKLGYDPQEIDALLTLVKDSFCGVGNPLGLSGVLPGQAVLVLGSRPKGL